MYISLLQKVADEFNNQIDDLQTKLQANEEHIEDLQRKHIHALERVKEGEEEITSLKDELQSANEELKEKELLQKDLAEKDEELQATQNKLKKISAGMFLKLSLSYYLTILYTFTCYITFVCLLIHTLGYEQYN